MCSENNLELKREFLFYTSVHPPLAIFKRSFRSEEECDLLEISDDDEKAIGYLRTFSESFKGNIYASLTTGLDVPNRIRSYKGIMHYFPDLKGSKHYSFELKNEKNRTNISTLIELETKDFTRSNIGILSAYSGILICSDEAFSTLLEIVPNWVSLNEKSGSSHDHEVIAESLKHLKNTAVMRYFNTNNGYDETIAVLGNEGYVNFRIAPIINSIKK